VPDDDHLLVQVAGVLDEVTTSQLGEALTSMIERNTLHLRVKMHDRIRVRCDPFPVLLGIRWRASAEGGCLSLAGVPPRLRQIIDREGLRSAFQSCRRLAVPAPSTATAL
jgi:anti-anti-sigma regulatory factor